ncbi:MAG: hypothetical protein Q8920_09250 [Bacillota bacterium]|nr:hypothetical protein [Bacillota bacterium]
MKINFSDFKAKRRLTQREFLFISLLVLVLEIYLIATLTIMPAWNKYSNDKEKNSNLSALSKNLEIQFANKRTYEKNIQLEEFKINKLSEEIPPYSSQEDIVLTMDNYSKSTGLEIDSLAFDSVGTNLSNLQKGIMPSNGKSAVNQQPQASPGTQALPGNTGNTTASITGDGVSLAFKGTYNQLYGFLSDIEKSTRKIIVSNISAARDADGLLNGTITLMYVSYREPGDNGQYKLTTPSTGGKVNPFVPYPGYKDGSTVQNSNSTTPIKIIDPDFYLLLNTYRDNAPKVIMGVYPRTETEVYDDVNDLVKGKITISQSGGKYKYTYTLGTSVYTEESALAVKDGVIRMNVTSQPRVSPADKVAIKMDIENKTSLPFEIDIVSDDKDMPRFTVGSKSGNVIVKR